MKRFHSHLGLADLDQSIRFSSGLFRPGREGHRPLLRIARVSAQFPIRTARHDR